MNLKLVLKTYSNLRQLTDDESALLETLRAMNDSERELLVESLGPQAGKKKSPERNIEHCTIDDCGLTRRAIVHRDTRASGFHNFQAPIPASKSSSKQSTKSRRTSGIGEQLSSRRQGRQTASNNDDADGFDDGRCIHELSYGTCGLLLDHNIHHLTNHPNHHPFQPPASTAAQGSTPASSGIDGEGAGNVAQGASAGE